MHGARVRALYDSEAVLRRLASALSLLGADDPSEPIQDENGARSPAFVSEKPAAIQPSASPRAALLGALRRGREVLDVADRMLTSRGGADTAGATDPNEP